MWQVIIEYVIVCVLAIVAYHKGMLPVVAKVAASRRMKRTTAESADVAEPSPGLYDKMVKVWRTWEAVQSLWEATRVDERPAVLPCRQCGDPLVLGSQHALAQLDGLTDTICDECDAIDPIKPNEKGERRLPDGKPVAVVPRPEKQPPPA